MSRGELKKLPGQKEAGVFSAISLGLLTEFVGIYTEEPALSEDFGEKAFLGANPRIAVVQLVSTPAVIAVLVVVGTLVAARSFAMGAAYGHKEDGDSWFDYSRSTIAQKSFDS